MRTLSSHSTAKAARRIVKGDPERYNAKAVDEPLYPEIKTHAGTPYVADMLTALLPAIVATREPATLEFVNLQRWHEGDGDLVRRLRGVILRDQRNEVLLYAYGIGIDDDLSRECYKVLSDVFEITEEETEQLKTEAWLSFDYSVTLHLS